MSKKFLKNYNKILAYTLAILGIGSATTFSGCMYGSPAEYGTPIATYKIIGSVTDKAHTKVKGIRVALRGDTTFTDANGKYNVQTEDFPGDQTFQISFEDIDGDANGDLQSVDTTVAFVVPEFENGDGSWNRGETSTEFNIKLKDK